jgi:hypothetical protein
MGSWGSCTRHRKNNGFLNVILYWNIFLTGRCSVRRYNECCWPSSWRPPSAILPGVCLRKKQSAPSGGRTTYVLPAVQTRVTPPWSSWRPCGSSIRY